MKPGLTLPAMKIMAGTASGKAELRTMRQQLIRLRDEQAAELEKIMRRADEVIHNMGIALGEIEA